MSFTPPAPHRNVLSEFKLRLLGEIQSGAKRRPTLGVSVHKNQPRIQVRTEVPNDSDNGLIAANMDTHTFFAFMDILKKVTENPAVEPENRFSIRNQGHTFFGGKRSEKPELLSTTIIGRDKDTQEVYLAVISSRKERPCIKFYFRPSEWHDLRDGQGQPLDPATISNIYASSYLGWLNELVPAVLFAEYVAPEPRDNGQGGGGNNWGNRNNNNGGNNRGGNNNWGGSSHSNSSAAEPSSGNFEDDIPF